MEIRSIEPKPYEKAVFPGISFEAEISYKRYDEAIIGVSGWLKTDDGKILAEIKEVVKGAETREIGAKGPKIGRSKDKPEDIYKTTLVALLDKRALDHIEKRRVANKKGDVILTLDVIVKVITNRAVISHIYEIKPEDINLPSIEVLGTRNWGLLVYTSTPDYYPYRTDQWILSGDNSPIFLTISEQVLIKNVKISSSDWIHDYAPKLGLGEYFVVEIPKGKKQIEEAWNYAKKAEECFRRWDIRGVFANCREVGYLLDRIVKEKFGKNSFNYKERWGRAYGKFEHLASLGLHIEEIRQKQQYATEDIEISRNDAELILIMSKLLIKYAEELLEGT